MTPTTRRGSLFGMRAGWALVVAGGLCACGADLDAFSEQDRALIRAMRLEGTPADVGNEYQHRKDVQDFGQALFFDERLVDPAPDGRTVACVSCHEPHLAFSDPRKTNVSLGLTTTTARNSMPLTNVGFYRWFAWDGRSDSLWGQVRFAYQAKGTMGGTPTRMLEAVRRLYRQRYEGLFGPLPDLDQPRFVPCGARGSEWPCDAMSEVELKQAYANVLKAVGAYMGRLVSGNAPIDRYAAGESTALSEAQKRGLRLFIGKAGCVGCHSGPHFSDDGFHALGLEQGGPAVPGEDTGRFQGLVEAAANPYRRLANPPAATPADVGRFRTMGLRNVALTAPYFHAGQAATLRDVVWFYNQGGDRAGPNVSPWLVPLGLTDEEEADLVAFLEALTGDPVDEALACNNNLDPGSTLGPKCGSAP